MPRFILGSAFALVALFAASTGCRTHDVLRDPLATPALPIAASVDLAGAASRQLELEAGALEIQRELSALSARGEWRERGYFSASESDAIEWLLFRFVHYHRAFWAELDRLGGAELALAGDSAHAGAHLLALHAGLALADSSSFLVTTFQRDPVAIAALNEAFYRTEIPAGTYDRLRLSITSPSRQRALAEAWALHERELRDPEGSEFAELSRDEALAPVLSALAPLWSRVAARLESLDAEAGAVREKLDHGLAADAARAAERDVGALRYRIRALVFKDASRIKSPDAHLIRFADWQIREIHELLRPGDLILTYTAGYVSDVFIPGAFKHGITYVGTAEERAAAGLTAASTPKLDRPRADQFAADLAHDRMPDGSRADLIEAVAEGVKFSNLDQILDTHVNRLLVLRPQLDDEQRSAFLAGVFSYLGDPYDFHFDFANATRQVCTEVHYRALNGRGGIEFPLTPRGGHPTLSADDIVNYHFANPGHFSVILFAEENPDRSDHAARLWTRDLAARALAQRMATP